MMRKVKIISFILVLLAILFACTDATKPSASDSWETSSLTIAVASNFHFPLSILIAESPFWSSQSIDLVVGSSGTLFAQLSNGAPFDLFFSADTQRPIALEENELASARQSYARGKLVLFPAPQWLVEGLNSTNTLDISGKIAIANPQLAPFGSAAKSYIDSLNNSAFVFTQLVLGANVTQAFQFVDSGNAQVGLLAESVLINALINLKDPKYRDYFVLPRERYPAIIQDVVIANSSSRKEHAQLFIDFVRSQDSQRKLASLGYLPINEASQ